MKRVLVAWLPEVSPGQSTEVFEHVIEVIETLTPHVEVLRPGLVAMPMRGFARQEGSEESAAEQLIDAVNAHCNTDSVVGAADGLFAAVVASRQGQVVSPGGDAAYLAQRDIGQLSVTGLVESDVIGILRHLGIGTLGDFAGLDGAAVAERFGPHARQAQLLCAGQSLRPVVAREVPPDLQVGADFDPPLENVETAVLSARPLTDRLHATLEAHSLVCTRVRITALTSHGLTRERTWQVEPGVDQLTTRIRWQLEGWLSGSRVGVGSIARLELSPEGVTDQLEAQLSLWESGSAQRSAHEAKERAEAAMIHVQSLLGDEAVRVAGEEVSLGEASTLFQVFPAKHDPPRRPGALPAPTPSVPGRESAELTDELNRPVEVDAGGLLSASPAYLRWAGDHQAVVGWAGPWPVIERWWSDSVESPPRRYARLQVSLADGRAGLLVRERRQWRVSGWYD